MLVLRRKPGQEIYMTTPAGVVVTIRLVKIRSMDEVEIGIEAPWGFEVERDDAKSRGRGRGGDRKDN